MKETDLYGPVKAFLERSGYVVRGEVVGCDLAAVRGEELVMVELKRVFGLKLLVQAVNRQKAADTVYVAIPKPPRGRFSKSFWDMCNLLRRLELGLLVVSFKPTGTAVEVVLHPPEAAAMVREPKGRARRNTKMRRSILREFTARSGDYNTGGSTRTALVTAYREASLRVAVCLARRGVLTAAELKVLGTGDKTYGILYHNVYGWFTRVEKGRYALHDAGKAALRSYPALADRYRLELGLRRPASARARVRA